METARIFKTIGKVRILLGLSFPEIATILFVAFVVGSVVKVHWFINLASIGAAGVLTYFALGYIRQIFPSVSYKHVMAWMSEEDRYAPGCDSEMFPLFHDVESL